LQHFIQTAPKSPKELVRQTLGLNSRGIGITEEQFRRTVWEMKVLSYSCTFSSMTLMARTGDWYRSTFPYVTCLSTEDNNAPSTGERPLQGDFVDEREFDSAFGTFPIFTICASSDRECRLVLWNPETWLEMMGDYEHLSNEPIQSGFRGNVVKEDIEITRRHLTQTNGGID
jgi:hypothetical protein